MSRGVLSGKLGMGGSTTSTNQLSLRHSSRRRPLKLSPKQFSMGLPGQMNFSRDAARVRLLIEILACGATQMQELRTLPR